ncbi:hypothetical protein [Afifella sp. YEN Y35]|uniref:hypothetical protein n=1 Tax=Afifella sp. YEN Y35 TaxID=3388337 RepID=UPI0039E13955
MLRLTNHVGFGARRRGGANNFFGDLQGLGLDTGLVRCVDAGAAKSYPGTGQTWADLSPAGNDLYLGSSSGADAADQAFTGTAGEVGPDTYFSSDGGDYFVEAAAVMTDWHKDNALWSAVCLVYYVGGTTYLFGNRSNAGPGTRALILSDKVYAQVYNASGLALNHSTTATLTTDAWHAIGLSLDEAGDALRISIDTTQETFTGAYTTPSTGTPQYALGRVGDNGSGATPAPSGTRFGRLAMWDGVALSAADLSAIYAQQKELFTTLP